MTNQITSIDLIIIDFQTSESLTVKLSHLSQLISTKVHGGEESELLFGLTHKIIIFNAVVSRLQDLDVFQGPKFVDAV